MFRAHRINKRLLAKIDPYCIYLVSGHQIRRISQDDHEFGDSATHVDLPDLVPENEIWIDEIVKPSEYFFVVFRSIAEIKAAKTNNKPYDYALKKERKLREIIDGLPYKPESASQTAPNNIYLSHYGTIRDFGENVEIWLVDAENVRDQFKTDYLEGGHGYVYPWIPNDEIWIESTLDDDEMPPTILHEFVERTLMKHKKLSYNKAHTIAAKIEFAHEDISKDDILSINKNVVLKLTKSL